MTSMKSTIIGNALLCHNDVWSN